MFKIHSRTVAVAALAALTLAGSAQASGSARTFVSIGGHNGDYAGVVTSPRPHRCADQRTITVYKQKGAHQNPQVDSPIGSDTAELHGNHAAWSIGNSGFRSGTFYARASSTQACAAAGSKSIHR